MATARTERRLLAAVPDIGGQLADPVNGTNEIPNHRFTLDDGPDDEITELIAVSDTPFERTWLTGDITADQTTIPVEDKDELPASGTVYIDRETVTYSGASSTTSAGNVADIRSGTVTANATKTSCNDSAYNGFADGYFKGAIIEITSGANNGEIRTVQDFYVNPNTNRGVFLWTSPMGSIMSAGDTFDITDPPDRLYDAALSGTDRTGAVITVTSGTNSGLVRWVKTFDDSIDSCEVIPPFPEPCDTTTNYTITLETLTGCLRGEFGSAAVKHEIRDELGGLLRRQVSTKVPFIKTREVRIYEGRDGISEGEEIQVGHGFIDDYNLDPSGRSYTFQCSGFLKILSRELMAIQGRATIAIGPLWGGNVEPRIWVDGNKKLASGSYILDNSGFQHFAMVMEDGSTSGFFINRIAISSLDSWPSTGNIKIDDEIIHYEGTGWYPDTLTPDPMTANNYLIFTKDIVRPTENEDVNTYRTEDVGYLGCYENRSLFADKIGLRGIKSGVVSFKEFKKSLPQMTESAYEKYYASHGISPENPDPIEFKAFMQEHPVGADIFRVCLCEDSIKSDFPRYDEIEYDTLASGTFTAGDTVSCASPTWEATVMEVIERTSTTGVLVVSGGDPHDVALSNGDTITNGTATASVDIFSYEVRKRNNPIDIMLQLLCSTGDIGTASQNGAYDTLPEGFGLGIDVSEIDIDAIERLRDKYFGGMTIEFVIHEPTPAKEFLEEFVLRPCQIFPFENYNGKLSYASLLTYEEAVAENVKNPYEKFDEDQIAAESLPDWTAGKDPIAKMTLQYNRLPTGDDYRGRVEVILGQTKQWYKDLGREIEIDVPGFYKPDDDWNQILHKNPKLPQQIRRMIAVVWDRQGQYPCPQISVRTPYQTITIDVGDIVLLTHPTLPNLRTGQRGLSDEYYQIVGRDPRSQEGFMRWVLWQVGVHDKKYGRHAPSAEVSAYAADTPSAGKSTITCYPYRFSAIRPVGSDYSVDVASFQAGDEVMFFASDYDLIGASAATYTIESVDEANNQIVLDSNVVGGSTPSDGSWMTYADYANCTSGQQTSRVFMADEDHVLDGTDSAFKYE